METHLKIEHLAPYLPYGLKSENTFGDIVEILGLRNGNESVKNEMWYFVDKYDKHLWGYLDECKPILYPLSDLTKEIEHNGEKFVPIEKLREIYTNRLRFDSDGFYYSINKSVVRGDAHDTHFPFNQLEAYEYLFEWHIDMFNLLENNLAIDINKLNK